jgi:hypothetical protein
MRCVDTGRDGAQIVADCKGCDANAKCNQHTADWPGITGEWAPSMSILLVYEFGSRSGNGHEEVETPGGFFQRKNWDENVEGCRIEPGPWSEWSACDHSCGTGTQRRSRKDPYGDRSPTNQCPVIHGEFVWSSSYEA